MNRIFSLVWNRALHALQVASELARSHGGGAAGAGTNAHGARRKLLALTIVSVIGAAFATAAMGAAPCTPAPPMVTCGTSGTQGTAGKSGGTIPFYYRGANGGTAGNGTSGGAGQTLSSNGSFGYGYATTGGGGGDGGIGGEGGNGEVFYYHDGDGSIIAESGSGGAGGASGKGGAGGAGIVASGYRLTNHGSAVGGTGGAGGGPAYGGNGGGGKNAQAYAGDPGADAANGGKGGEGGDGGSGGAGVAGGRIFYLSNYYKVTGGKGGNGGAGGGGGAGGTAGIGSYAHYFAPTTVGNGGTGGDGGNGSMGGAGGIGGAGVGGSDFLVTNHAGAITGGAGGNGGAGGVGGSGGIGGGGGGIYCPPLSGYGAGCAELTGGSGGPGGNGGNGGNGGSGGVGGSGVAGSGFTLDNYARIVGGTGGNGGSAGKAGSGGAGGDPGEVASTRNGTYGASGSDGIMGIGGIGGNGGAGVTASGNAVVSNADSGSIIGGAGGAGGYGFDPNLSSVPTFNNSGDGGAGVAGSDFSLTNLGSITGGSGGPNNSEVVLGGGETSTFKASTGGAGVDGAAFTLVNGGTITGGMGGKGYPPGPGGAGVHATGGASVTNSGSISGGLGGDASTRADAIDFSGGGNTLTLGAGYKFVGNVVSSSGTINGGDTLALGGDTSPVKAFDVSDVVTALPSSPAANATYYVGFAKEAKTGTSTWQLIGSASAGQNWTVTGGLLQGDTKSVTGNVDIQSGATFEFLQNFSGSFGSVFTGSMLTGSGSFMVDAPGAALTIANADFNGTTEVANGTLDVGDFAEFKGAVLLNANTTLDNFGTLAGGVQGNGGPVTVINSGSSSGLFGGTLLKGILLTNGGSVSNSGTISSAGRGVEIDGTTGKVSNAGSIKATGTDLAVALFGGGEVDNAAGGTLASSGLAVYVTGAAATLRNSGTIIGGVTLNTGVANTVELTTGGRIAGNLDIGTNSGSILTLDGTGTQLYSNAVTGTTTFGGTLVDAGDAWIIDTALDPHATTIDSGVTLQVGDGGSTGSLGSGGITNNGTLVFDRGNAMTVDNVITGGSVSQTGSGALTLASGRNVTNWTIDDGSLQIGNGTGPAGIMAGWGGPAVDASGGVLTVAAHATVAGKSSIGQTGSDPGVNDGGNGGASGGGSGGSGGGGGRFGNFVVMAPGTLTMGGISPMLKRGGGGGGGTPPTGDAGAGGAGGAGAGLASDGSVAVEGSGGHGGAGGSWGAGGAGGGGGGYAVAVSTSGGSNAGAITGGAGAAGAATAYTDAGQNGGAGGGGGGGLGALIEGGIGFANSGSITGGKGGAGGKGYNGGGNGGGGGGGAAVALAHGSGSTGPTFTNTGTVTGGAGAGNGSGGAGLVSDGGATVVNEGTISGGLSGDGSTRADAIDFTGGGNTLELVAGKTARFNGAISVTRASGDAADTLELGGDSGRGTFDVLQLASTGTFGGFNAYEKSGGSSWELTGTASAGQNWTIDGGLLWGDTNSVKGNLDIGSGGTFEFSQPVSGTFGGALSGAGGFYVETGGGVLTLTDANSAFTGSTSVSQGTLEIASGAGLGSGGVTVSGSYPTKLIVDSGATLGNAIKLGKNATLDNAGNITQQVSGSGSAATVDNSGSINGNHGGSAGVLLGDGGAVTNSGKIGGNYGVEIDGATGSVTNGSGGSINGSTLGVLLTNGGTVTNDGTVSGRGGVEIDGAVGKVVNGGTIKATVTDPAVDLSAGGEIDNAAGGALSSEGVAVSVTGGAATLRNAGTITGGATLGDYANTVDLTAGGRIAGNLDIGGNSGSTLTLDGTGTQLYSRAVTGTTTFDGDLLKAGGGTWVIDNNGLSQVADTTIGAGTLQVDGVLGDGSGTATVNRGATLSGTGIVNALNTEIDPGAFLDPGDKTGWIGTLTFNGSLSMLGNLGIDIDGTNSGKFDFLDVNGDASFGSSSAFSFFLGNDTNQQAGDTFKFFGADSFLNFADASSNFSCNGLSSGLTCALSQSGDGLFLVLDGQSGGGGTRSVPEPGSLGMLGLGLLLLGGGCWRKRNDRKEG